MTSQTAASGKTVPEHTAEIVHRLEATSKLVREHLRVAAQGASKWYNHKSKPRRFAVGDRVRVYYPRRVKGRSVKWQSFFSIDGRVERRINDATYLVKADRWRDRRSYTSTKSSLFLPSNQCNLILYCFFVAGGSFPVPPGVPPSGRRW